MLHSFLSQVTITTRHLISHKSGIRHYKLKDSNKKNKKDKNDSKVETKSQEGKETVVLGDEVDEKEKNVAPTSNTDNVSEQKQDQRGRRCTCGKLMSKRRRKKKKKEEEEFDLEEYYFTDEFETVEEALEIFQNDDLFFKPGE